MKISKNDLKNMIAEIRQESSILLEQPGQGLPDPGKLDPKGELDTKSALHNVLHSLAGGEALPGGTKVGQMAELVSSMVVLAARYELDDELVGMLSETNMQLQQMVQEIDLQIQQAQAMQQQLQSVEAQIQQQA